MSWQLASFLLLAAAIAGGFAWYERSRPAAPVVALVASLAAFALAGRLAFAAVPNVVATTDIVLLTGYALGAGPGFAVGAVAAIASNVFLGQGPWTPWQMAAWGGTGVAGALLAAGFGRGLGRVPLALVCGLAGLAFGAVMNASLVVTYGAEDPLAELAALQIRAIPFDVAHATGNMLIALAAGPAFVRMLKRFRERFQVRWVAAGATPAILVAAVLVVPQTASAQSPSPAAIGAEVTSLSDSVAREWARPAESGFLRSTRNGRVERDPGQPMLAYGLLRTADRAGDGRLGSIAREALVASRFRLEDAFVQMAQARSYEDARTRSVLGERSGEIAAYLRSLGAPIVGPRARPCNRNPRCYNNLKLVDATASLLLLATGLDGGGRGTKLGSRETTRNRAVAMVTRRVPRAAPDGAGWSSGSERRSGLTVISDPRPNPLAYHNLSVAMVAQTLPHLSPANRGRMTSFLRRALGFSVGMVGPDGDLTYMGRGQLQVWTQASSLYAALTGARLFARSDPRLAGELLSLARLNLDRLQEAHRQMGSRGGLAVVREPRPDYRGVDHYATHTSYNGLALYFMNLAVDAAAELEREAPGLSPVALPADRPEGLTFRDPRGSRMTVVRRGNVWMAVHAANSHRVDLRYDWGLLAAKRLEGGRWSDLLPPRPLRTGDRLPPETVGPALATRTGRILARPLMSRASVSGPTVTLRGRLAGAVLRRVAFRFSIAGNGIEVSWPSRRGDRWRFIALAERPRRAAGRRLRAQAGTWLLPTGAAIRPYPRRFHSAYHPDLYGYLVTWAPRLARTKISLR